MFPFYNQTPFPYHQQQPSQNQYLAMLQQTYQLNPLYNTMVQIPQPFYYNSVPFQQSAKPPILSPTNTEKTSTSSEITKTFSCNCINTDCRKQYCICFKNGEICGPKCGCSNCRNRQMHERNVPLEKKRHVSCNCKKSECAKKYCECYANGIKCNEMCHCCDCKNC